jgi:RHS repeat-associated protein
VGATGQCTVTLNATQLSETVVPVTGSAAGVLTVPASVTVPANTLTSGFGVTAVAPGSATITAGPLNETSKQATVQVQPPPATLVGLTPSPATLLVGASTTLSLTLNAAQATDTAVALASTLADLVTLPASITVPAGSLTVPIPLTGIAPGTTTITAGPLNGSTVEATVTVNQLPATVTSLTPTDLTLPKGTAESLTVTIAPVQSGPTAVPLASTDPWTVEVPASVPVPAGSATAAFPVIGRSVGSATVTAGPHDGTRAQATVTVTPPALVTLTITPTAITLAVGQTQAFTATGTYTDGTTQDLTSTAAWTSGDETIATITNPGGVVTARAVGQATITVTADGKNATATVTVTPPALTVFELTPTLPTRAVGQAVQFTATGTFTDGTTHDLTGSVTWTSSDPTVATITSPGGLATALAVGQSTITVTHADGLSASTTFTVFLPPPVVSRFTPSSGKVGTLVTVAGVYLGSATSVRFNGTTASFTVVSATLVTATVPSGATSGPITVTTPAGSASMSGHFLVLPTQDFQVSALPAIVAIPAAGQAAVKVSLTGAEGFSGLTTLAASGVPTGTIATFSTTTLAAGQSTLLVLQTGGATPADSYPLLLTATGLLDGVATTRSVAVTLQVQPSGQTSLSGRVLDEDAQAVRGAVIRLGSLQTTTDDAGNFLLLNAPAGANQLLLIDGGPASTPERNYPIIPYKVTLLAGQANTLGFTPYLHVQKTTGMVNIANTSVQRIVTDASLPGFEMKIPAGVSIIGWDGQPNTQVSIRRVSFDRNPLPPIPADRFARSLYMYYFGKAGGGIPSSPVPVTVPNDLDVPPGTQAELWYYDEAPDGSRPNAWAQYGTGTVSADGSQIVPDLNPATGQPYGQPRFCCGAMYAALAQARKAASDAVRGGTPTSCGGDGERCGDPVDVATGIFTLAKTDVNNPGRLPITFTRTYRTMGPTGGPFGPGTSHSYNTVLLNEAFSFKTLLLPDGGRIAFARQTDGMFRNVTAPRMRGAVLSQSGSDYSLRFKDGATWTFREAISGTAFLIGQTDRAGNRIILTRSGVSQLLTTISDTVGRQLTLDYDAGNRITTITDPLGRTVRYGYDGSGRLTNVTDQAGGVTRYTYDTSNRLLTITDPRNITFLTNEYDASGRVARQTHIDGAVWTFAYTVAAGVVTQTVMTDPSGNRITRRFNGEGYRLSATDAQGQATTSTRDSATNQLLASTDALDRRTRYTYDAAGNVTQRLDTLNQPWIYTYHPTFNQVTSTTDPLGNRTTFEYDAQGNLIAIIDPVENTKPAGSRLQTTFTYNAGGQPLTVTDPMGHTTTFEYDSVGSLTATIDPLGNRTERTYDAVSRLLTVKDPKGAVTRFSYDPLDRLVATTDPLGGITRFTYDGNGNLLTVTDAKGQTTSHTYDAMNRLETRTDPLGRIERFTYDGNGNLLTATDRRNQTTIHTYDATNRRIRTEYADGSSVSFSYDAVGNLLAATDSLTGTIAYTYDLLNRRTAEQSTQGTVLYTYDAGSRRAVMQASGLQPVAYGHDANSRLTGIAQGTQTATLAYDPASRRTSLVLPNGITVTYTYDEVSRLLSHTYTGPGGVVGDLTYQYDVTGNRVGTGGSFARTLVPAAIPTAAYDASNAQLAFGPVTQTFDPNGNLLTQSDASGTTTYMWDARNRLVGITGSSVSASFAYDALGRRLSKTINGQTTIFLYDGLDVVRESGPAGDASYLRTLAIDEALSRDDGGGAVSYVADILGSTVALADAGGALTTTYTYAPFGETSVTGLPSANAIQYTGRENDGTGLYYYRARYYDPTRSRFVSEDPIGFGDGWNMYAYVGNSPLTHTDPFGLQALTSGHPDPPSLTQLGLPPYTLIPHGGGAPGSGMNPGAISAMRDQQLGGLLAGLLGDEMTRKLNEYEDRARCGKQFVQLCSLRNHPYGTYIVLPAGEHRIISSSYFCSPPIAIWGRRECCYPSPWSY